MKNPFAMMALMAAVMTEAFRENKYRDAGIALPSGRSRSRIPGKANQAGAKQLKRFYKAKNGIRAESVEQAREWYAGYLAKQNAAACAAEEKRRHERASRKAAPLRLAA